MDKDLYIQITNKTRALIAESPSAPPGRLSEILVELTSLSATLSEALDDILVFKPERLIDLKQELKTVKEAEWAWKNEQLGKQEVYLRGWLLRIKENKSAIKSRLQILHDEAYGQY
jgi:hypothetical protein